MDVPRTPSRTRRYRRFGVATSAIALVALLAVGVRRLEPATPGVDRGDLTTDSVRMGEMVRVVRGPGTLVPERVRWVPAATGGRVERVLVQPGDAVEAGTILLELSNPDVQLEALDAQRQFAQAQADLVSLESTLQTQRLALRGSIATLRSEHRDALRRAEADRELARRGLIARLDLERTEDRVQELAERLRSEEEQLRLLTGSLESRLSTQRAQVDRLRSIVSFHSDRTTGMQVLAGAEGVVQELPVQVGQWVTPGSTLARVVEPGRLRAVLRIPETQARDLSVGQSARIDTRSGIVEGRVVRVDPAVQGGTVTVDVALEGELPRGARPDLSVDGTIEIDRLEDVLHVARPPYVQANGAAFVWRLVDGGAAAERIQVRLGRASFNEVEIVEGLQPGDLVVTSDLSRMDGVQRIRVRR